MISAVCRTAVHALQSAKIFKQMIDNTVRISNGDFECRLDENQSLIGFKELSHAVNAMSRSLSGMIEIKDKSVRVKDTGKGIPKEDIQKIFEPFFMVDRSRKRSYGGFGLGLSICAQISDMLNLSISVDSAPGEGSIFEVDFPEEKAV